VTELIRYLKLVHIGDGDSVACLSTLAIIVADFGDNLSPKTASSRRFRWQCGQGFRDTYVYRPPGPFSRCYLISHGTVVL